MERRIISQTEIRDKNGNLEYTIIPNYRVHKNFMTDNEKKLYKCLIGAVAEIRKTLNEKYTIFTQVALNRIIDVNNNRESKLWEDIRDRSIDFVIYDEKREEIKCCIELNDETHKEEKRIDRDNMIAKALKNNIDLIFIERKDFYNIKEIINLIIK